MTPAAPPFALLRPGERLTGAVAASIGLHVALFGLGFWVGGLSGDDAPPLQPSVMVVEPLYALPLERGQLPDRPQQAPPPEAGDRGAESLALDEPEMTLPDPDARKEKGDQEERDAREKERRKREELMRLSRLEVGDRDVAPSAEDAVAPPDWAEWNPSGNANADPILGAYIRLVRDRVQRNWHVIDRSVVKESPEFYVVVSVLIDREGGILDLKVSRKSGSTQFDSYAKRAVKVTQDRGGLPRPDDKVWSRLTEGRYQQAGVDILFAPKDMSLQ